MIRSSQMTRFFLVGDDSKPKRWLSPGVENEAERHPGDLSGLSCRADRSDRLLRWSGCGEVGCLHPAVDAIMNDVIVDKRKSNGESLSEEGVANSRKWRVSSL